MRQDSIHRVAVVLFNLGGADSINSVRPFLLRLFNDRAIINLPQPLRYLLAQCIIWKRLKQSLHNYAMLGGKSPLLQETIKQAKALEAKLHTIRNGKIYKVLFFMRYWHPTAEQIIPDIMQFAPNEILLLPLYPQFSTTTTGSALLHWSKIAKNYNLPTAQYICCYPMQDGFVNAYAELILEQYQKAYKIAKPRILFSAHSLPISIIESGDPYAIQITQSVHAIVDQVNIKELDWVLCYQSKIGSRKWLEPSVQDELIKAARDKLSVIIVPITFVSEHLETLIELDVEYKKMAQQYGINGYFRVPSVGTHPLFIDGLARLCTEGSRICSDASYSAKHHTIKNDYLSFCKKHCTQNQIRGGLAANDLMQ